MIPPLSEPSPPRETCAPPTRQLFIYYLSGRPEGELSLGDDFLGHWQEEESAFLFFRAAALGRVESLVESQPRLALVDHYQMPYDQWQGEALAPFTVDGISIRPPWRPAGQDPQGVLEIVLDPGVVFGNGQHTTTRDCLKALQLLWVEHRPARVLDLGCGSGVLALAAAALGARRVLALDLNHLAVRTAWANVRRNNLQQRILAIQGRAETFIDRPAELVMANIHFAVMAPLVADAAFSMHRFYILSGLLRSEAKQIEEMLARRGARVMAQWPGDGIWITNLVCTSE